MKRIKELIRFLSIVCFGYSGIVQGNNTATHTVSFDITQLNLKPTVVEETPYTEINWNGLYNQGKPGMPSLPVHSFKVSVPCEASNFSVCITVDEITTISLPAPPYPAQYPVLASFDYDKPTFVHLLSSTEDETTETSVTRGSITEVANIGGFNKTVSITVNPILWNADAQTIEAATNMTINLSWSIDVEECKKLAIPGFQQVINKAIELTREIVVNPEDVESNCSYLLKSRHLSQSVSEKEYIPYVIVTTKDLETSLERLAALRRLRGFQTKIFCIEDIISDSRFEEGDIISELNDDAGKLRAFLKCVYAEYGTQYVLLAGDYPKIPGRWLTYSAEDYISDQYYRDLTTNWKSIFHSNGKIYPSDLSATNQDLCVGRISLKNSNELDNYLEKVIQYEFNVNNIDLSYLDNAFVMCGHDKDMHDNFDSISLKYYENYFSFLKQLRIPEVEIVYGKEAIESMKTDFWGFVDWRCHGHYGGVGTSRHPISGCYGINALDSDKADFLDESLNGLDTWFNTGHPCWTLSMSCNLAEFGYNRTNYNFADSFILGKDYGGVVFIGNTGPGIKADSDKLIQQILNTAYRCYSSKLATAYAGYIFKKGHSEVANLRDYYSKHVKSTIGIFGDPLASIWMKQPEKSNFSGKFHPTSLSSDDKINYSKHYLVNNMTENGEGSVGDFSSIEETENYTLINYRMDIVPFIHPTKICGLTLNRNQYWITGKLRFTSSNNQNSIKLIEGKQLTVEALDEVNLEGNIELEGNSSMKIVSYKPVSINSCKFKGEGNVCIDATGKVEIGKNTSIPKGVRFTISKPEKK